jgi:SGNH hydrolase-like domain, acetyltransferase AlgX
MRSTSTTGQRQGIASSVKLALAMALGVLSFLLAAEVALRMLPVTTGVNLIDGYGTDHPLRQTPGSAMTFSRDWDFLYPNRSRFNTLGYHGHCALAREGGRQTWLLGDSFAAAMMLPPEHTLAAQMQYRVGTRESVCSLALAGTSAADFLTTIDAFAGRTAHERWVIVLNGTDVQESMSAPEGMTQFDPSLDGRITGIQRHEPGRSELIRRESALNRYFSNNLGGRLSIDRVKQQVLGLARGLGTAPEPLPAGSVANTTPHHALVELWVRELTRRARRAQAEPVIVMNAFHPQYFQTAASLQLEQQRRSDIMDVLKAAGVRVIDVEPLFASASECRTEGSCYLFRDRHWSPTGHALVAVAVQSAFAADPR